jgi:hypothetical protein
MPATRRAHVAAIGVVGDSGHRCCGWVAAAPGTHAPNWHGAADAVTAIVTFVVSVHLVAVSCVVPAQMGVHVAACKVAGDQ